MRAISLRRPLSQRARGFDSPRLAGHPFGTVLARRLPWTLFTWSNDVAALLSCLGDRGYASTRFPQSAVCYRSVCIYVDSPRCTCLVFAQSWLVLSQGLSVGDDVALPLSCLGERGCARRLSPPPAVAACAWFLTRLDSRANCWNSPARRRRSRLSVGDDFAAPLSCLGERGCACRLFPPPAVAACARF